MKTQDASSGRFRREKTLKDLGIKTEYVLDEMFTEEDITNAVITMREKLKEYGNDYLVSYYDKIFGRWD